MQWKKLSHFRFALYQDEQQVGQMTIDYASAQQSGDCRWQDQHFLICRTGFWKSGVEIEEAKSNEIVLKAGPKKWYSNRLEVAAFGQQLELKVWNNPLAEWALEQNGKPVLAYGLSTDGAVGVRITVSDKNVHPYYHFLLWYLFFPVALENGGDDPSFSLLLNQ
jgi:hypothetical protein